MTRNVPRAVGLLELAADEDVRAAQLMLSDMYALGIGVKRDPAQALKWAEKAALADDAPAAVKLGKLIERGQGSAPDVKVARDWYELSAEQDYTKAMNAMAQSFLRTGASDLDREYAAKWLELAVENGNAHAAYVLAALCVARGPDDPAELARAEKLLEQAVKAPRGPFDARTVLKKKSEGLSLLEAFRYVLGTPRQTQMADHQKERVARWETAGSVPARRINWKPAQLPESVRLQQLKGAVRLSCTITKAGLVEDIKVLSSPHPALTEAVVAQVRQARYIPALKDGQRITTKMIMNIDPTYEDPGLDVMSLSTALPEEVTGVPTKPEKP